jgi:hypothetical protein
MNSVELLKGLIRLGIFARRLNRKPLGHRFVFRILCNISPCSHTVSARLSIVQDYVCSRRFASDQVNSVFEVRPIMVAFAAFQGQFSYL